MSQQSKIARRRFFAVLGGAAAGAAVKLASSAPPAAEPAPAREAGGNGYRLTDHIKKYYRTTTV